MSADTIPEDILSVAENVDFDVRMAHTLPVAVDIIARAILAERKRISAIVSKWKRRDHLSLHVGEVTAQEFRTVVAVLISIDAAIQEHEAAK